MSRRAVVPLLAAAALVALLAGGVPAANGQEATPAITLHTFLPAGSSLAVAANGAPLITLSLREDDHELNVARLHLREMLEPSPIFRDIVEREIAPLHAALAGLVARHCGLAKPDAEVHQLSFAMIAMANDYCSSREFIRMLAPAVLSRRNACAAIVDRLVGYCVALLSHEQARRKAQSKGASRGRRVR